VHPVDNEMMVTCQWLYTFSPTL